MGVVRRLTQAIEIPHDPSLTLAQQLITVSMPFALQQYPCFNLGSQE